MDEWDHERRAADAYAHSSKAKPIIKTVLAAICLFTLGSVCIYNFYFVFVIVFSLTISFQNVAGHALFWS